MALTVADVDFERRLIRVRQGKGGVDRNVPMSETLVVPLRELCRGRGRRSRLFTVSPAHRYRRMVKLARACGLEGFHPHSLRHAFATRLVARGANLKAVQQLLGHASLETTAVYLDMAPEHLRAAVVPRERSPLLRGAATRSCHAEVTLPRPPRGIIDRPKPGYDALGFSLTWTIAFCS